MKKKTWHLANAMENNLERLNELLVDGWEPFSVIATTIGGEKVWVIYLRKLV